MSRGDTGGAASDDVARWYEAKTADLLRKYGPGPRVHYHTGVFEESLQGSLSAQALRLQMVAAQEQLLEVAADTWQAEDNLCGDVLDVGCGLGGGAIFWAERYGARVVALTNVARHAQLVGGFARAAGVADRVVPVVGDACDTSRRGTFDAVVAVESACYLPRFDWMRHAASQLRPGGCLFIADVFATRDTMRAAFDADWLTRVGTAAQYEEAAERAGLKSWCNRDLTRATLGYWALSISYHRALLASEEKGSGSAARSIARHGRLARGWDSGGLEYRLLGFRRPG